MYKIIKTLGIIAILVLLMGVSIAQAQETCELLWSYETGDTVFSISMSSNGDYIVVGSDKVYFFNKDGGLLWSYDIGNTAYDVSVSSDGNYIAANSYSNVRGWHKRVCFFDKGGKLLWSYGTNNSVYDVLVSLDGNYIVIGGADGVHFLNKNGELLWSYKGKSATDKLSISLDGDYVAATNYNRINFFNKEGKLLWDYKIDDAIRDVSMSSDGNYIATASDKRVHFFNKEGKLLWCYETSGEIRGISMSIDSNCITAIAANFVEAPSYRYIRNNTLYFLNNQGELVWSYDIPIDYIHSISVSSNGNYVVTGGGNQHKVYLFNNEGELLWIYENSISCMGPGANILTSYNGNYIVTDYGKTVQFFASNLSIIVNNVKSAISETKSKRFDVAKAENLLSQGEKELDLRNYERARDLVSQAYALAIDVDQDGIFNERDIAPTIKNVYVYGFAVSLTLASVSFTGIKIRRRKYEQKINAYKAKIEQWEREGYAVSEFRERWFK